MSSTTLGIVLGVVIAVIAIAFAQVAGLSIPFLTSTTTTTITKSETLWRTTTLHHTLSTTLTLEKTVTEIHTLTSTESYTVTQWTTVFRTVVKRETLTKTFTFTRVKTLITTITRTTTAIQTITTTKIVVLTKPMEYTSIESALEALTKQDIEVVGRVVLGDRDLSPSEAVWRAIEWVEQNLEYDTERAELVMKHAKPLVYHPLKLIAVGKGICTDFALLYTATMLYTNISPIYIVALIDYRHAVTAVPINGTLIVLERHLPPMEFSDYIQYILGRELGRVHIYRVELGSEGVEYRILGLESIENLLRDSYPQDVIDSRIGIEVAKKLSDLYGFNISQALKPLAELGINTLIITLPEVYLSNMDRVGVYKFYSPIFRDMWVQYLANIAAKYLEPFAGRDGDISIWVVVKGNELRIAIASSSSIS